MKRIRTAPAAFVAIGVLVEGAQADTTCTGTGVELQVLGSGGPELQDKRASSSYVVWRDGKARVLIDAGGGAALWRIRRADGGSRGDAALSPACRPHRRSAGAVHVVLFWRAQEGAAPFRSARQRLLSSHHGVHRGPVRSRSGCVPLSGQLPEG